MNNYTQEELQAIRKDILEKIEKLTKNRNNLEQQDPFNDTERVDNNAAVDSEADEQEAHARLEVLSELVDENLHRWQDALKRLDQHTYGLCIDCGQPIEKARLKIDAANEYCLTCSQKNSSPERDV